MARPSATAALLLLLLSLLAVVAHCRPIDAQSATDDAEPAAVVAAGDDDENGTPNPTLPAEVALPAEHRQQHGGFLRLPSHRLRHHRPCRHGHHLWWARHHGAFGDAQRRFRFHHRHGVAMSPLAALPLPAQEAREAGAEEVKAVAEPDPDRSLPDGEPAAFADADGAHEAEVANEDEGAAVRAWKKEMLRRWFHFHHRHGMRLHRHHHDEEEEDEAEGLKRFHHHHHLHKEEEEKDTMMGKRFRHAEHDGDDEDEEVEEMVRRFRKAVMRRRFGHGRRFHHHHYGQYRHAEEAEKADAQEEGGVVAWIKSLVNRF